MLEDDRPVPTFLVVWLIHTSPIVREKREGALHSMSTAYVRCQSGPCGMQRECKPLKVHKRIEENFSLEFQDLLKSMLSYDPYLRPNIHELLNNPVVLRRVAKLHSDHVELLEEHNKAM
eukprot:9500302-Pyramimonas_sp.AAC.1